MLGTLPAERLDAHFRVVQRERGVLIMSIAATIGPFESASMLARQLLDLGELALDELAPDQPLLPSFAARIRARLATLGDDVVAYPSAIWMSAAGLELWTCGRDDLLVFDGAHVLAQRCAPRLVQPATRGSLLAGIGGPATRLLDEPSERLPCRAERVRVVLLQGMSSAVSLVPALIAWQRAHADETSARQLAELAHEWVFDRSQQCGFVAVVDAIAG
jgi:hypothetical protein